MPNPAGFVALCGGCAEVMNWTRLSSAHRRDISSTVLHPATSLAVCVSLGTQAVVLHFSVGHSGPE
jgi:hypothetical protein